MQFDNNMVKSQTTTDKDSEPTIHFNLDDIFEQMDIKSFDEPNVLASGHIR